MMYTRYNFLFIYFQVIDAYIADLSLRVGDDRHLCSAVKTMEMLQKYRNKQLGIYKRSEKKNDRKEPKKKGIKRVMEVYFVADKVKKIYFSIHMMQILLFSNMKLTLFFVL